MIQTDSTQADLTCKLISMYFMSSINTEKNQLTREEKQGEGFQVEFELGKHKSSENATRVFVFAEHFPF